MSESNFREIQLNTKQVIFLFLACMVALLGVFLLGVRVGHGVGNDATATAAAASEPANDPPVPSVMPPATTPKPDDFGAYGQLPGKGDSKATPPATPPNPSADAPPDTAPAPKPAETPAPRATPAAAAPKPAAAEKPPSATAIWYVQIDSFGSKDNAEKQLGQLKAKGHEAFVFTASGGGAKYKTRIGPLERNAADALKNRLSREGYRPSVIK